MIAGNLLEKAINITDNNRNNSIISNNVNTKFISVPRIGFYTCFILTMKWKMFFIMFFVYYMKNDIKLAKIKDNYHLNIWPKRIDLTDFYRENFYEHPMRSKRPR